MPFVVRLLLTLLILFALEFYFAKKTIGSIKNLFPDISKKKIKRFTIAAAILLNLYPIIGIGVWVYAIITQQSGISAPENIFIDYLVIFPFWIIALIIVQSLLYLLPLDILKLVLFPLYKKNKTRLKKIEAKIVFALIIFFSVYIPVRIFYDMNKVSTRLVEYAKENLPEELDGLKIALISDVQADRHTSGDRLNNFIETVNETSPDLILIAGDVITNTPFYINTAAENLGKLKAKYGIYSCVGDHDNWAYRFDNERSLKEIKDALNAYDIPMIDNENRSLEIGNSKIGISFITWTYPRRIGPEKLDSLTNELNSEDLKIFLTHQPRQHLIDKAIEKDYDLLFAGHTHGGQITFLFPFFNPSVTHLETNYVKGDFWFGDMLMIITRGLGMSLAPVRYNSTPEVTVIKLNNKTNNNALSLR